MAVKKVLLALILVSFGLYSFGQKWKKQRTEFGLSLGPTLFYGDVGAGSGIGEKGFLGFTDFNLSSTRFAIAGMYRYQLGSHFFVKGQLGFTLLSDDDANSGDVFRKARKMNISTSIFEFTGRAEYQFMKQKVGSRYKLKGVKQRKWLDFGIYGFLGFGGMYFTPKGTDNRTGTSYNLAELGTNGRGIPGGHEKYSQLGFLMPFGVGLRKALNPTTGEREGLFTIGLEFAYNFSFNDNLDDLDGSQYFYYSTTPSEVSRLKSVLAAQSGDVALYMTEPANSPTSSEYLDQYRGSSARNDAYFTLMVGLYFKLPKKRATYKKL